MTATLYKLHTEKGNTFADAAKWYGERLSHDDQVRLARMIERFGAVSLDIITTKWIDQNITKPRLAEVSPGTVARDLSLFGALLNFAFRTNMMHREVWIDRPTVNNARTIWLTKDERDAVIEAAEPFRFKVAVAFLFHTGARLSEALGATVADAKNGCVTLQSCKGKGKVQHIRTVPLRASLAAMLDEIQRDYYGQWLLPGLYGKRWSKTTFTRRWSALIQECGLSPEVVPHVARHTFTSLLIQAGHNPIQVAKLTGHRDPRSLARYAHLDVDSLRQIIEE